MTAPSASRIRTLTAFRDPSSVAVVGASADPAKWGHWLARGALRGAHRRDVYFVGRGGPVLDRPVHAGLADLPAVPELVALAVPAPAIGAIVDEALALGTRAFLGITAGVPGETEIAARIRAAGARLVGMNSLGLFDAATDLQLAWGDFHAGSIAVISQSGQLGSEIAELAARAGLGISRFVSIGNQTDVGAVELLDDLIHDEGTRVVALYLESFAGGDGLVRTIRRLRAAGKYTLLLTVGACAASARLARSHTGSMTSALDVVDAAMRAAGAIRVRTPGELVEIAALLSGSGAPDGARVAVIGDSGGQTGIAADVAADARLRVVEFSTELTGRLAGLLPEGAACGNPVDLAGAGERDLGSYLATVEPVLDSGEADAVVLTGYFGRYALDNPASAARESEVARALAEAARSRRIPVVVHSMATDGPTVDTMRDHGLPVYSSIETALRAVAGAARLAAEPREVAVRAEPVAAPAAGYAAAQEFLRPAGVRFPAGTVIHRLDDLDAAVAELRAPYVLKASWLEHKSEAGGVVIGLSDVSALRAAFAEMHGRLGDGDYVVEEQDCRNDVVEMILGVRRDPGLGPVVLLGTGGTEAELHRDVALELAPVDLPTAHTMVRRLASHRLLTGWRGRPATDVDALAELVVTVSERAAATRGVTEIDINPLRVGPDGVLAVDALVVTDPTHPTEEGAQP